MVVLELEVGAFSPAWIAIVVNPSRVDCSGENTLRSDHDRLTDGLSGTQPVRYSLAEDHRLDLAAFGVTSRLPLQSLPTLTLLEAESPAVVAASEMSLGST